MLLSDVVTLPPQKLTDVPHQPHSGCSRGIHHPWPQTTAVVEFLTGAGAAGSYRSGLKVTFSQPGSARTVPLRLNDHLIQAHAWSMFVAWGVILPMGVIGARYFKVLPPGVPALCRVHVHVL